MNIDDADGNKCTLNGEDANKIIKCQQDWFSNI